MKKWSIVGAVALPFLFSGIWFFWPEIRLLTTSFPKTADKMQNRFRVTIRDNAGIGGDVDRTFSAYRLGARRILWLEHRQGESIDGDIVSADILYNFGQKERDRVSNKLLENTSQ
ncbi:MAG: hypothetical protein PHP93_04015 [Kiritimatiellales bacterium]|nr:hypothetical protein [Kiritimatiellales bacterium]